MKNQSQPGSGYPLETIYFYLTAGCNLRCRHCWISPRFQGDDQSYPVLEIGLFRSILEQAKPLGLRRAKLTGGEPFMHPQIIDILRIIRENEISLIIETNGVLGTAEIIHEVASIENCRVAVSLDGADAETHEDIRGVRGCFAKTVDCIRAFVSAGISPQIIMTVMRRNVHQMEAMVGLAESLGSSSVKFNLLQPTARGEALHKAGQALSIKELVTKGRWVEKILAPSHKIRLYFDYPIAFRALGRIYDPVGGHCGVCGILSILGVLADGSYSLCGIGEQRQELVFGHAISHRLEDVWRNSPVLHELREGLPHRLEGICGKCLMKGQCIGSCIAQNFYRSGNLWSPFWFCEEAQREGIFPESRLELKSA